MAYKQRANKFRRTKMEQKQMQSPGNDNGTPFQFLSEQAQTILETTDANPYIKISAPDKSIPFIVLPDGGVIVDNTANNPKIILKNFKLSIAADKLYGAGIIDVYHGNKTLLFRHIESSIFEKQWRVDDIASALQLELNVYYPGYNIRSH